MKAWDARAAGGGGGFARTISTPVVTTIAGGGQATITVPLAKAYRLFALIVNAQCRVRLYTTAAGAAADTGRAIIVDPPDGRGVMLDYVTTHGGTYILSPLVDGVSMETSPSSSITALVDNLDTISAAISVSFDYLRAE